jgi:hypothetical protein
MATQSGRPKENRCGKQETLGGKQEGAAKHARIEPSRRYKAVTL